MAPRRFFCLNYVYVWLLIGFGSAVGLNFFRKTDYSLQLVGGRYTNFWGFPLMMC